MLIQICNNTDVDIKNTTKSCFGWGRGDPNRPPPWVLCSFIVACLMHDGPRLSHIQKTGQFRQTGPGPEFWACLGRRRPGWAGKRQFTYCSFCFVKFFSLCYRQFVPCVVTFVLLLLCAVFGLYYVWPVLNAVYVACVFSNVLLCESFVSLYYVSLLVCVMCCFEVVLC